MIDQAYNAALKCLQDQEEANDFCKKMLEIEASLCSSQMVMDDLNLLDTNDSKYLDEKGKLVLQDSPQGAMDLRFNRFCFSLDYLLYFHFCFSNNHLSINCLVLGLSLLFN